MGEQRGFVSRTCAGQANLLERLGYYSGGLGNQPQIFRLTESSAPFPGAGRRKRTLPVFGARWAIHPKALVIQTDMAQDPGTVSTSKPPRRQRAAGFTVKCGRCGTTFLTYDCPKLDHFSIFRVVCPHCSWPGRYLASELRPQQP